MKKEELKAERVRLSLTQKQMAEYIGLKGKNAERGYRKLELGERPVPPRIELFLLKNKQ
jgi:transcriptional regulator with XRE-family HTH domain